MRHRGRVDTNHAEIVAALRKAGCSVESLASVGKGCPDLLCGYQGRNVLLEVKHTKGRLTEYQVGWHVGWNGSARIVRSVDEALAAVRYVR